MTDSLILTSRFVMYLPSAGSVPEESVFRLASQAAARTGLRQAGYRSYFFAYEDAHEAGPPPASRTFVLDLFPGTGVSLARRSLPAKPDWATLHNFAETHAQFYNLLALHDSEVRLESDRIGLKPYYLSTHGDGTIIASRVADILRLFPHLARPVDKTAIYQLIVFKAPLGERTLHQRIKRGATGACHRWTPGDGLAFTQARRLSAPAIDANLFNDAAFRRFETVLSDSISRRTKMFDGPVSMSFSGGFDSRLLAAMATAIGVRLEAFTFGRNFHSEVRSAVAIAKTLGIRHKTIDYRPDNSLKRVQCHLHLMEGMADLGITHIANLLDLACDDGEPILHGYAGDVLAGNHIRLVPPSAYESLDRLADEIATSNVRLFPEVDAWGVFALQYSSDELKHEIRESLQSGCEPHQSFFLWDFENRQRRYIGGFFPILGMKFHTIAPYYDEAVFKFWLSVPPIALDDRNLFRRFLSTRFPELATVRHPEEPLPIRPNLRRQLDDFWADLPRSLLRQRLGPKRANDLLLRWNRSRTIWTFGNLLAPQLQKEMLSRSERLRSAMEDTLGIEVSPSFSEVLKKNQQALRNMFLIAEYAAWLKGEMSEAGAGKDFAA